PHRPPPVPPLSPYTRSSDLDDAAVAGVGRDEAALPLRVEQILPGPRRLRRGNDLGVVRDDVDRRAQTVVVTVAVLEPRREHVHRSEEHTSELQSRFDLVCRL